jgi:hypothetical protein
MEKIIIINDFENLDGGREGKIKKIANPTASGLAAFVIYLQKLYLFSIKRRMFTLCKMFRKAF